MPSIHSSPTPATPSLTPPEPATSSDNAVAIEADDATLRLIADADAITHGVCCRDAEWRITFCGAEEDTLNMAAENYCSMCAEEILRLLPNAFENDPFICPKDHKPCPPLFEVELRVMKEINK
ncbi:hypothetical protein GCM10027071_17130 [Microbacterium marinum]